MTVRSKQEIKKTKHNSDGLRQWIHIAEDGGLVVAEWRDDHSGVGVLAVLPHHIDYLTRSQNNDSTNIIIISPNYHRIIHKNNPRFNRKKFQFEFENGEVLRLKLYEHLKA